MDFSFLIYVIKESMKQIKPKTVAKLVISNGVARLVMKPVKAPHQIKDK